MRCRKAFTFARGVLVDDSWEELARRDISGMGMKVDDDAVGSWVGSMKAYLAGVTVGSQYVALDGYVIATDSDSIEFDGWRSHHQLDFVPHVAALTDGSIIDELLSNVEYWESRRVAD